MKKEYGERQGQNSPGALTQQFSALFASKDWLNKDLKISYQSKKYRLSCSQEMFLAYQVNDNWGISPGAPGWPVCIVTRDYVTDGSSGPDPSSTRLSTGDWLNILAQGGFELA